MAIRNLLVVVLLFLLSGYSALAQSNYTLINNASAIAGCHCYQLTPDVGNQGGGVYQNNTINLNNSFDYKFNVFLGCNGTSGADGICFILTNNITGIGAQGGGLGYSGLSGNSLATEYDTYQNSQDPSYNHIAFESGGSVNHNVAGPVPALASQAPIADCQWHTTEIIWNAITQTYSVYFDGVLRLSYTGNIVANFFGGNPIVNWGWSGSTGGAENTQQFCVESTSNWTAGTNYQSCTQTVQFSDISTSNVATVQSWLWNFGDPASGTTLDTSHRQNPTHTFSSTGTFTVTLIITDISGCPDTFTHTVTISPPISLTATPTDPPCNGGNNGSIALSLTGGFGAAAGYGGFSYSWNDGQTTSTDIGLTAGTHNVTVTDGICTTTASYTLNQPPALSASTSHTDAPCGGTGTATITISGGTPGYSSVTWDGIAATGGPNTFTASGLPVGTVVANFQDAHGCSALLTYRENIASLPCGYTVASGATNVTCYGGSNGTATLTVTGINGGYTITWVNAGGTQVGTTTSGTPLTGLAAGVYTYTFTDALNTITGHVTVNQPGGSMAVSLATSNTSCSYLNDGSAVASVTAFGTPNYTYAWTPSNANSPTASGLSPGPVSVIVTDANNCTATASGTVTGQTPVQPSVTTTPDSCYGDHTGTATVSVTGGNPNYTYQWSSGPTGIGASIYAQPSGNYVVTVTDHNGCTATASGTIGQPALLTATMVDSNVACHGGANGSATVTPAGGNGGFTYAWSGSASTTNTASGLAASTYYVTVTDSKRCVVVDSAIITQPATNVSATSTHINVRCSGPTGSITVTATNGNAPYTIAWSDGPSTSFTRTNLIAGIYNYTVTDAHLCTVTGADTITSPVNPFIISYTQVNDSCFGNTSGSIVLTQSGGTLPYATPLWLDGAIGLTRSNLPAGIYYYGDSDANGCLDTGSVVITQPASAFTVTATHSNLQCFGLDTASIILTLSGGTTPYGTVYWRDGGATGATRTNLAAGNYSYYVSDAYNCTDSATITISGPTSAFTVVVDSDNVRCKGIPTGDITLHLFGGTSPYGNVTWSDASPADTIRTNLAAGTYGWSINDANGCSTSGSVNITEPATAFIVDSTHTDVHCFGGSDGTITLTPSGGTPPYATTQWLDGASGNIRNNLPAGTYYYGDSDINGCLVTASIIVSQPATAFTVDTAHTDVSCFGGNNGTITLTPAGGTPPYVPAQWLDGYIGDNRTNLVAGTYYYADSDANGCLVVDSMRVSQPTPVVPTIATMDSISCFGANDGSIVITTTGGNNSYTYTLDGGTPQNTGAYTGITPGPHSVLVADGNGCDSTITFNMYEPALLTDAIASTVNDSCFGQCQGVIVLSGTGGTLPYQFSIDGVNYQTSDTFSGLCANPTYTVSVKDAHGCQNNTNGAITQPPVLMLSPVDSISPTCNNGPNGGFDVIATGGTAPYQYAADGGAYQASGSFTNQAVGGHTAFVKDANGCTTSYNITIINPPATSTYTSSVINDSCAGGSTGYITINVTGTTTPYTYNWSASPANGNVLGGVPAGTYTVTVIDGNSCTVYSADSVNTITQPTPVGGSETMTPVTCYGGSNGCIAVTDTGGTAPYTNSWSNGNTTTNPCALSAGSYIDTITDNNGCRFIYSNIVVTQPDSVAIILDSITPVSCVGLSDGAIAIHDTGGTPGYSYLWSNASTSSNPTGLAQGPYQVIVTDSHGCADTANFTVGVNPPMTLSATKVNVLCPPLSNGRVILNVTGGAPGYSYLWNNGSTNSTVSGLPVGVDSVVITDSRGCTLDTSFAISNDSAYKIQGVPDTVTINQGDQVQVAIAITNNGAGNPSQIWSPGTGLSCTDCQAPEVSAVITTLYSVAGSTDSGCKANTSVLVIVNPQHQLYVPNAFTPNNDGTNDIWEAFGYKKAWIFCEVEIFDRWGEKVFQSTDINFGWDGKYRGSLVEPGVYTYVLKVVFVDDYSVSNKGTITVIR